VLRRTVRDVVVVSRWGGDELLVAITDAGPDVAAGLHRAGRIAAERLTAVLGRRATVSIGVAEAHPRDTWETAVGAADAALYVAKANGRDTVVDAASPALVLP